jgi:hypothetical protein
MIDPKPGPYDADIKRLMQRATESSDGNVVGFFSALLAAKLVTLQQEAEAKKEQEKHDS